MKLPDLPELPEPKAAVDIPDHGTVRVGWTAAQTREFAIAYGEAVREACAKTVEATPAEAFCTVMHQAQLQKARETFAAAIRRKEE